MTRRAVRPFLIATLLSVLSTFAVAWLCGLFPFGWGASAGGTFWPVVPGSGPQTTPRGSIAAGSIEAFGVHQHHLRSNVSPIMPGDADIVLGFFSSMPQRLQITMKQAVTSGAATWVSTDMGWPWPGLSCSSSDIDGQRGGWTFGMPPATGGPARAIAWKPLWPGFGLNVLVFTAAWLVILVVPKESRRTRRRRRGLCERCGYDLRGNAEGRCPECGNTR